MTDRQKPGNICLLPVLRSVGGPTSFQLKFKAELEARGFDVHHNPQDPQTDAILVIAGTRRIDQLWKARQRGVRIVQRLDGMNWIHRKRRTGLKHYLRSEYGNWLLSFIRRRLAHHVVYQSDFSRGWWERVYGPIPATTSTVLNGVDLTVYTPEGPHQRPTNHIRVQMVEGHLKDGLEQWLVYALQYIRLLQEQAAGRVELVVAGDVPQSVQHALRAEIGDLWVRFTGVISRSQIPELDRSAHLFYSAEINAPCPNSVVEALACGLPVAAFDSGSLAELVQGDAGRVVPYGGNPWNLEKPDIPALAAASVDLVQNQEKFRTGARRRAEEALDVRQMTDQYLQALFPN